jgi:DNA-binding CsgD family transcriptional regulator
MSELDGAINGSAKYSHLFDRADPTPSGTARRQTDHESDRPGGRLAPDYTVRRLTPREREIALLVAEGLKDVLIARRLDLSVSTVRSYVGGVKRRLGLGSRHEIVAWVAARRSSDQPDARLRRAGVDRSS